LVIFQLFANEPLPSLLSLSNNKWIGVARLSGKRIFGLEAREEREVGFIGITLLLLNLFV